jgi:hypothetical protein
MKPLYVLAGTIFLATSFCASAQTMKPGLWEISNKMQTSGGQMEQGTAQMQQEMAGMPPEQRKMMQDMMARQGVSMGAGGPAAMGVKVCMTKEMVERNEIPAQQGECKHTTSPRSGNTMKISFTCTKPPSSGEGQVTIASPEAYTMKMTMTTVVQGKPEKVNMEVSGRWLSADCGAIKPMAMPRK